MNELEKRYEEVSKAILTICIKSKQFTGPHEEEIIDKIGGHKSEVRQILKSLVRLRYLNKNDTDHYKISELGRVHLGNTYTPVRNTENNYSNTYNSSDGSIVNTARNINHPTLEAKAKNRLELWIAPFLTGLAVLIVGAIVLAAVGLR